ncbi:CPBP family intramembrane glutamic endopeptidase [Halorhabdus rudnickae]|uniref:CPBP family intramembrane glutamic endopeptidase n=1 Tax=Halorhabdus rudnickae TaxID=1775544 RepID=UPI00108394FD|nr:CPBP family intramembrane glutamic endopeptidase [Halorhabdus rudnickae]
MTRWAGFVGLTALLISVLLVLTRLTQRLVESDPQFRDSAESTGSAGRGADDSPTIPSEDESVGVSSLDDGTVVGSTDRPDATTGTAESLSTAALVANVALTQGTVAVVVAAGAWYFDVPLDALGVTAAPASVGLRAVLTGLVVGVVLWFGSEVMTALSEAAGFGTDEGLRELLAPETTGGWLALLGFALPIVAVSEELLFRAAAIGVPAAGLGTSPWVLAIVSSVAFGFCHGIQGQAGVLVTGLLGLALAGVYVSTGSLLVVIVAHYVLNATEFLVQEGLGVDPIGG